MLDEAHHLVVKLLTLPEAAVIAEEHPWPRETDRWRELVFALLTRVISRPEQEIRDLTNRLQLLGLLEIDECGEMPLRGTIPDPTGVHYRRMLEVFNDTKISRAEAIAGSRAIHEAARVLVDRFEGRIARCIRAAGAKIVEDLLQTFRFEVISERTAEEALTYWVQNVMSIPLSLNDESVRAFCRAHGITPKELETAADDLDVSIALVDDLTDYWVNAVGNLEQPDGADTKPSRTAKRRKPGQASRQRSARAR